MVKEGTVPQIRRASAADAGVIAALIRELGDDCEDTRVRGALSQRPGQCRAAVRGQRRGDRVGLLLRTSLRVSRRRCILDRGFRGEGALPRARRGAPLFSPSRCAMLNPWAARISQQ